MTDSERLERALAFATEKHKGQFRIGGEEYITHPIAVCEIIKQKGFGTDFQITALFHDLLEDTNASEQEILKYGNEKILGAVKLLTKKKPYSMADYMGAIRQNEMACEIKGADRLHNLRCALVADEKFKRKYILETVEWYLDLSLDIRIAVKELAESLEAPLTEYGFLYEPIDTWKI